MHVLEGGTAAWAAAGYVLFTGVNVPSKAFGEWVEHHYGTESVDAPELKAWQDEGRDLVVLDSRPIDEFHRMSIPGGINVPGGELAYRIGDLAPDPDTIVVVNCAGRTRSIMGAESLRRAGVPNRVVALRNGTMGWELAGLAGRARARPSATRDGHAADGRARARAGARRFAEAVGRRRDRAARPRPASRRTRTARSTCSTCATRPSSPRGTAPGSRNAPGGQLVQATDQWIGVRGARIALIDDDGVRARMTGAWLRQMGHRDVFVVEGGLDEPGRAGAAAPTPPRRTATDTIPEGALVIDLARSIDFRAGHIPGAIWARADPARRAAGPAGRGPHVVLTSPDGVLARLAVDEVAALTAAPVHGAARRHAAWARAAVRSRPTGPAGRRGCIDFYLRPYDRNSGVEEAMHAYLSWEIDLVREIERDGTVAFGV